MPRRVAGGEPSTQELEGRETKQGTMAWWDVPGSCQLPLWAHPGRNVLCRGWYSPVCGDEVHHRSHPSVDPGQPCLCAVGGGGKMPLSPSMGNMSGEWEELLASEPGLVQAGPHHETWCSSLMKISFISALYQHSIAPALGG